MKLNALTTLILITLSLNANAQGLLSNLPEFPVAKADTTVQMKAASAGEPVQFTAPAIKASSTNEWQFGEEVGPQLPTKEKNLLIKQIRNISKEHGVPAEFLIALVNIRNPEWNENYNQDGKQGLLLITQYAAVRTSENACELQDVETNIRTAAKVLALGIKKYNKQVNSIMRYYLCGNGACSEADNKTLHNVVEEIRKLMSQ